MSATVGDQTLRPYQQAADEQVSQALAAGHRRVLLVAPCGAGKTTLARARIERARLARGRVVFLAHRRELIDQCSRRLAGIPHGIIRAGTAATEAPVQVASMQTLLSRGERPPADLVIVDEAHRSVSDGYARLLALYPQATLLGLTATPWRLDGRGLGDQYDCSVLAATPADLIAAGYLAPYSGFAYDSPQLRGAEKRAGDYTGRGLELVMGAPKLAGNIVASWLAHASGVSTVVFGCTRAHSRSLADRFAAAGVAAEHVDGGMRAAERDAVIERFRAGTTRVVVNVGILTEGFDLPAIGCVVLARPTLSTSLYLQQCGRTMRPQPGKVALIHDHAGNVALHGLPDAARDYSLTAATRGVAAGATAPSLRTCLACFAIFEEAARCPACGAVIAPRPRPMKEIEAERVSLAEAAARGRARETTAGKHLGELYAMADGRGYRPGWVLFKFQRIYGRFPSRAERQAGRELADRATAAGAT